MARLGKPELVGATLWLASDAAHRRRDRDRQRFFLHEHLSRHSSVVGTLEPSIRSCPLCDCAASSRYMAADAWNNRDSIELRRCSACDFVFSAEADFSYEEFFAKGFVGASKNELMLRARAEGLDKLVADIAAKADLPKRARVLDFGAGVGLAALSFVNAGFDVVVVEESKPYVEGHKALGLLSFPSISEAREHCGLFDLVVMKDVLEHLSAPRDVLSSVTECVKPGGHFYIRVPNAHAYRFVPSVDTRSHVNHFTPQTLVKLLAGQSMAKTDFVSVFDISSRAGKLYNAVFWHVRSVLPFYHQISLLCRRALAS